VARQYGDPGLLFDRGDEDWREFGGRFASFDAPGGTFREPLASADASFLPAWAVESRRAIDFICTSPLAEGGRTTHTGRAGPCGRKTVCEGFTRRNGFGTPRAEVDRATTRGVGRRSSTNRGSTKVTTPCGTRNGHA